MDKNKNYYQILNLNQEASDKEIKKAYYKLSYQYHPDKNKTDDISLFNSITEAYNILSNKESRDEYDLKSKFGKNYNEYFELFDINVDFSWQDSKDKLEKFKKYEVHNIQIEVNETFDGYIEYERWVKCKKCDGSGKDLSSKIVIKDSEGNVIKTFDADDGCDFCEGSGKDWAGNKCTFCSGNGKVGLTPCKTCNGEKRILGKQKLSKIKLTGDETKIDTMGHFSKDGVIGYLILKKK